MAQPPDHGAPTDAHDDHARRPGVLVDLARIAFVLACAGAVWFKLWEPWSRISLIGVTGIAIGGWPIFDEAVENARERRMTMELSMAIALVAALAIGEFFTALIITAFVLVAEVLEGLTVARGRRAIRALLDFLPPTATVRRDGALASIPLGDVHVGDVILIAPGGLIPVDGTVVSGASFVDQSTITGESSPVPKGARDTVYAGTINQSGALEIATQSVGAETSFGKIIDAVERAERSRAPVQRTADRYAGYLVYFALACAILTFLFTRNVQSTISVIIVAGACGIAAGTPLAVLGAIGRAAREGAIIKGGRFLEALWDVDTVAFDKTGTLTVGAPVVTRILPRDGVPWDAVLQSAAIAECRSEHPLAKAIVRRAGDAGLTVIEPDTFHYTPGRGVLAAISEDVIVAGSRDWIANREIGIEGVPANNGSTAESEVLVARSGALLGRIFVADAIRDEAPAAVRALHDLGLHVVLLTGDSHVVADAVGRELGVDEVNADLLPDEKVAAIESLIQSEGRTVAMVGDGVNDAPALARAAVGIAMGSGTDVARESADIVLLGNDLSKLVETIRVARRARDIIRFNFAGTIVVDIIGVGLAAIGLLNPLVAAFIHVSSELAFILNSARLLPGTRRQGAAARP